MNIKINFGGLCALLACFAATAWSAPDEGRITQRLFLALQNLPTAGSSLSQVQVLVRSLVQRDSRNAAKYYRIGCSRLQDIYDDYRTSEHAAARASVTKLSNMCSKIVFRSKLLTNRKKRKIISRIIKEEESHAAPHNPIPPVVESLTAP